MRTLLIVTFPNEPFNSMVRDGTAGKKMGEILDDLKPEAAYFTEIDGHRAGILVLDLKDPSQIPTVAEPFFLHFNAQCKLRIAMTVQDLQKSHLDTLGKKWG